MIARLGLILASLAVTAGAIALLERWLNFSPLILFVAPVAAVLRIAGVTQR